MFSCLGSIMAAGGPRGISWGVRGLALWIWPVSGVRELVSGSLDLASGPPFRGLSRDPPRVFQILSLDFRT